MAFVKYERARGADPEGMGRWYAQVYDRMGYLCACIGRIKDAAHFVKMAVESQEWACKADPTEENKKELADMRERYLSLKRFAGRD